MQTECGFGLLASSPGVPLELAPGMRVGGRYELRRKIGAGAMGQVWAAKHISLKEDVAIKLVLREAAHDDGSPVDRRFLVEARIASQLSRKTRHVVNVTDHGHDGSYAYLVMELLDGESLDARLARTGPMALRKVVALIHQVARALALAHADGIVHRDLKPTNVFVTLDEDGKALIKLLDFGIAKLHQPQRISDSSKVKTMPGCLIGTPAYMSPEQARGEAIDHRADVWALAVIAYELLTGKFPFDGATPVELFSRICYVDPTPITDFRSDLDVVSEVFSRAFAEPIAERFASATDFACALERASSTHGRGDPIFAISAPPPKNPAIEALPQFRVRARKPPRVETPVPATSSVTMPLVVASPTIPPPPPHFATLRLAPAFTPPGALDDLVAAGIPRRPPLAPRLLVAIAAFATLLTTCALFTVVVEPSDPPPVRAAVRTAPPPSPPPPSRPTLDVPPPPAATTPTEPARPTVARAAATTIRPRVSAAPALSASVAASSPRVPTSKRADPSDVF